MVCTTSMGGRGPCWLRPGPPTVGAAGGANPTACSPAGLIRVQTQEGRCGHIYLLRVKLLHPSDLPYKACPAEQVPREFCS